MFGGVRCYGFREKIKTWTAENKEKGPPGKEESFWKPWFSGSTLVLVGVRFWTLSGNYIPEKERGTCPTRFTIHDQFAGSMLNISGM